MVCREFLPAEGREGRNRIIRDLSRDRLQFDTSQIATVFNLVKRSLGRDSLRKRGWGGASASFEGRSTASALACNLAEGSIADPHGELMAECGGDQDQ